MQWMKVAKKSKRIGRPWMFFAAFFPEKVRIETCVLRSVCLDTQKKSKNTAFQRIVAFSVLSLKILRRTECKENCKIHIQQWKMQEIYNPFHGEYYLISKRFSNFEHTTSKNCLSSNAHQFCKPKYSCLMRETAVKRISFFLELYEVYSLLD